MRVACGKCVACVWLTHVLAQGNVETHNADGPFFAGSVLKLETNRDTDPEFNFVHATSSYGKKTVYNLHGNGTVTQAIGDLRLLQGSAYIQNDNGVHITTADTSLSPALSASSSSTTAAYFSSTSPAFDSDVALLQSSRPSSADFNFLRGVADGKQTFSLSGEGSLLLSGSLTIKKPDIVLNGEMPSLSVPMSVVGTGGLSIKDGGDLTLGKQSNFLLTEGTATINGGASTPLTLTRTSNIDKDASATLSVTHDTITTAPFLSFSSGERGTLFSVQSSGGTRINGGLTIASGGANIATGGLEVGGGGLRVAGGIELVSGPLTLSDPESSFQLSGGLRSGVATPSATAVHASASNAHYSGTLMALDGVAPTAPHQYLFLDARANDQSVFSVSSDGGVTLANAKCTEDLSVDGGLQLNGHMVLKQSKSRAQGGTNVVEINVAEVSFFEIEGGGGTEVGAVGKVKFTGAPKNGQVLLLKNSDSIIYTLGDSKTQAPPNTLLLFVYTEGSGWSDVTAAAAHVRELKGVTELTAMKDLDIGDFSFAASRIVSKEHEEGQLVYFGPGGVLTGGAAAKIDKATGALKTKKLSVEEFLGDIDFKGGSVKNAALVNPTIDGVKHLNIESLGVLGEAAQTAGKFGRVALFNDAGRVSGEAGLKWGAEGGGLAGGGGIGGLGSGDLNITSSVDCQKNVFKNFVLEKNSSLKNVKLSEVVIENAVLNNVTATDLELGAVTVEGVTVTELDQSVGALVGVGAGGKLKAYMGAVKLTVGDEGVAKEVVVGLDVEVGGNKIKNANLYSGVIGGGELKVVGDVSVGGRLDFGGKGVVSGAVVVGGKLEKIDSVSVEGGLDVKGTSQLGGEVYVDGSLTVGGSVLGSGPYVDASDRRFKKGVEGLGAGVLEGLARLEGVRYEVDEESEASLARRMKGDKGGKKEIGFIAQDVEKEFPELVREGSDGYLGVAYSRMVAVLVEGVKELKVKNDELREEMLALRRMVEEAGLVK